jgi:ribokinase
MTRIINIGSINIDHVYSVPHFVRAGETLAADTHQVFPGGKGLNQSIALARADAMVWHAGMVGADGAALVELLRETGVDVSLIETGPNPTGHTVIQITPDGQNTILLFCGANMDVDSAFADRALKSFGAGDILVIQDEIGGISYAMDAAIKKGMRVALTPSARPTFEYPRDIPGWFLLNEIEGNALTGERDSEGILAGMAQKYPNAAIVLTLGEEGVLYRAKGGYHSGGGHFRGLFHRHDGAGGFGGSGDGHGFESGGAGGIVPGRGGVHPYDV